MMVDGLGLLAKGGLQLLANVLHASTQFLLLAGEGILVLFLQGLYQGVVVLRGQGMGMGKQGLLGVNLFSQLTQLFLGVGLLG